ncbi:protein translocase SEC61 complex subunit gamma [Candidatus Woesearchaeota archaeon]|nr:protein translocase SEC61 complex subunit gamma [Candidatus Woesearchaeota archaeon]
MDDQGVNPSWQYKVKSFLVECLRVLRITKKPDAIEFKTIVKVSGLGILIIGAIGFVIQMAKFLLF